MKNWIIGLARTICILLFCDTLVLLFIIITGNVFQHWNVPVALIILLVAIASLVFIILLFRRWRTSSDIWTKIFKGFMVLFLILLSFLVLFFMGSGHNIPLTTIIEGGVFFLMIFVFVSMLIMP